MSSKRTKSYRSFSTAETQKIAGDFAASVSRSPANFRALVVTLQGDLGAGKTTFVQGFLRGLGFKNRAQSPTFVIMRRHALKKSKKFKNVFHIDAYRLSKAEQLEALGVKKLLADPANILLIEWPERIKGFIPRDAAKISFRHGKTEEARTIIIRV